MKENRGSYKFNWHDEETVRDIVLNSISQSDVLRKLGLKPASNAVTLRKYIEKYQIDTSHFDPYANRSNNLKHIIPLSEILVENSQHSS